MIHIYDTVIEPYTTKIKRYGSYYHLDGRTRMGDQVFYTFKNSSREPLLVVPRFAEQYKEMEAFCRKFAYCPKFETCRSHITREVSKYIDVDDMPNDKSTTGIMKVIHVVYKDIRVQFEYMNNRLELSPEFEIISNNLFGNGIVVLMNINMEE